MTIGENLKSIREQHGLTQPKLSNLCGISQQNISRWENNTISPNIEFCIILADFYGISIDDLVGHEVKKNW